MYHYNTATNPATPPTSDEPIIPSTPSVPSASLFSTPTLTPPALSPFSFTPCMNGTPSMSAAFNYANMISTEDTQELFDNNNNTSLPFPIVQPPSPLPSPVVFLPPPLEPPDSLPSSKRPHPSSLRPSALRSSRPSRPSALRPRFRTPSRSPKTVTPPTPSPPSTVLYTPSSPSPAPSPSPSPVATTTPATSTPNSSPSNTPYPSTPPVVVTPPITVAPSPTTPPTEIHITLEQPLSQGVSRNFLSSQSSGSSRVGTSHNFASSDHVISFSSTNSLVSPKRKRGNDVISRTLSLGRGVIDLIFSRPFSYMNAPTIESRLATLRPGAFLNLDNIISIENVAEEIEDNGPTIATLSQVLAPCARLFRDVPHSGIYRLHISDPSLLLKFRSGTLGQSYIDANNELMSELSPVGKYEGSTPSIMIPAMYDVILSIFQAASFSVAQSHLNAITRSLDDISAMLDKIHHTPDQHAEAKLRAHAQEVAELADLLALLASVRTTDAQRVELDTRVGRLRLEARVILEEAYAAIEENKVHFKKTLQRKESIDKEELGKAANMFSRLCLCVKLSICLANLLHQRDIICDNDASYIQLSNKHLLAAIDKSHRLHETLQMFSPALLKKHGMFAWVKSFFYVEQPKLLHAMRRWKRGMEGEGGNNGNSGGIKSVSVVVKYERETRELRLVCEDGNV